MMSQALEQVQTDDRPSDPNKVLWLAVINQAVDDYESYVNGRQCGQCEAAYRGAFHWITQGGDWFCQVCNNAGLDPEAVQLAARRRAVPDIRLMRTR